MSMATLGAAALILWFANWCWIMKMIIQAIPDYFNEDVDKERAVEEALMNMDQKHKQFLKTIVDNNPFLFWIGVILVALSLTI